MGQMIETRISSTKRSKCVYMHACTHLFLQGLGVRGREREGICVRHYDNNGIKQDLVEM